MGRALNESTGAWLIGGGSLLVEGGLHVRWGVGGSEEFEIDARAGFFSTELLVESYRVELYVICTKYRIMAPLQ